MQHTNSNENLSNQNILFRQDKPDHHYRTEIPNIIGDLGLSPMAVALYFYIKRIAGDDGSCWKRQSSLLTEIGMTLNTYLKYRTELEQPNKLLNGKSLIKVFKRKKIDGGDDTNEIFIENIWRENGDYYKLKNKLPCSDFEGGAVQDLKGGGSRFEHKEEPLNKNLYKNTTTIKSPVQKEVVVFSCMDELDISKDLKVSISQKCDEQKACKLVKRVKDWKARESDEIACKTILLRWDTWKDVVSDEIKIEENKKLLSNCHKFDGKISPKTQKKCTVTSTKIVFEPMGQSTHAKIDEVNVKESNFKIKLHELINRNFNKKAKT